MLSGMFVAPELVTGKNSWDQQDWDSVMSQMKAVGIDQVVIQYSVQYYSDIVKNHYYVPGFEQAGTDNTGKQQQIPFALKAAKKHGVKIWLGLHIAEDAWFRAMPAGFQDLNFLIDSAEYSKKIFDDLWSQFKGEYAGTIAGWYLPFEFNNVDVKGEAKTRLINYFYKPLTQHIKSVTPDKLIMVSPLVYASLTVPPAKQAVDAWKDLLYDIWANTRVDVIAPQDGCGWESTMKETLEPWYKAMDEARRQAQPVRDSKKYGPALAWNNPESYSMNGTGNMTIKRLTDNMKAVDKYVSAHVSFSLHSLAYLPGDKPGQNSPVNELYYRAYEYAVINNRLYTPGTPIAAPENLEAKILSGVDVQLSWDRTEAVGDQMPVAGYEVWRKKADEDDSQFIRIKELSQPSRDEKRVMVTDYQTDPGTSYVYAVYAFDATGNRSSKPAIINADIDGFGIALNRTYGADVTGTLNFTVDGFINTSVKFGSAAKLKDKTIGQSMARWDNNNSSWTGIEKTRREDLGRFNLNIENNTGKKLSFIYISMLNQPTSDVYLPEKIDVIADGRHIASYYPYKEYSSSPVGAIWIPVDLGSAVDARKITLQFTQKFYRIMLSEVRVYEGKSTSADNDGYVEPVSLIEGQPVMITGYPSSQNFNPDSHFGGVTNTVIDTQKGTLETSYLIYKGNYSTYLLTRGAGKGPQISWHEDTGNSVWLRLSNLGSTFELSVDLKAPSTIRAIETEWLIDRDATVFLPNYIEFYGVTTDGVNELIGKAYRPSVALLDFDKAPSESNTHRIETKAYRIIVDSSKLYEKITAKVFVPYPANTYFVKNLIVH